jgi:hypothetical protein
VSASLCAAKVYHCDGSVQNWQRLRNRICEIVFLPRCARNTAIITGNRRCVDTINSLLQTQILPACPERISHIEARNKLDDSSSAKLSLEGYLQHSSGIYRRQLQRWLDAAWTPMGRRLSVNPHCKKFRALICILASHVQIFVLDNHKPRPSIRGSYVAAHLRQTCRLGWR